MPEFQWLAAAFPNFVRYVVVGFALAGFFLLIYVLITPWREFRLIRAGNTSAAIALVGALLGFCLPLANTVADVVSPVDLVLWSLVALGGAGDRPCRDAIAAAGPPSRRDRGRSGCPPASWRAASPPASA